MMEKGSAVTLEGHFQTQHKYWSARINTHCLKLLVMSGMCMMIFFPQNLVAVFLDLKIVKSKQ